MNKRNIEKMVRENIPIELIAERYSEEIDVMVDFLAESDIDLSGYTSGMLLNHETELERNLYLKTLVALGEVGY